MVPIEVILNKILMIDVLKKCNNFRDQKEVLIQPKHQKSTRKARVELQGSWRMIWAQNNQEVLVKLQGQGPMTFFIHFLNKKNTNAIQTTQAP